MTKARKMRLIPADELDRLILAASQPANKQAVNQNLMTDMKNAAHAPTLGDDEKWKLYEQALHRLINVNNIPGKPIKVQVDPPPPPAPTSTAPVIIRKNKPIFPSQSKVISELIANNILNASPKAVRASAAVAKKALLKEKKGKAKKSATKSKNKSVDIGESPDAVVPVVPVDGVQADPKVKGDGKKQSGKGKGKVGKKARNCKRGKNNTPKNKKSKKSNCKSNCKITGWKTFG